MIGFVTKIVWILSILMSDVNSKYPFTGAWWQLGRREPLNIYDPLRASSMISVDFDQDN